MAIARSEVAVAARSGSPATRMSSGTATMPPPTPKNAEKTPAASPMATRRTRVSYEHGQSGLSRRDALQSSRERSRRGSAARQPRDRDRDVRRAPRPPALSEPDVRRLLGRARERRADSVPRRPAETALLRRASVRRRSEDLSGTSRRSGSFAARSKRAADKFGVLLVSAVYAPAGKATVSGGFYRVFDNGIRCIRAPCFSTTVSQVNGSTRTTVSDVDLAASGANPAEIRRAQSHVATKTGLYARGRFAATPDGGRVFRALRLYLRVA